MCNDRIGINRSRKHKRQPYFCCSYRCSRCALRGSAAVEPVWCNNRNLCGDRNVRQVDSQLLLPLNSLPPIFVSCPLWNTKGCVHIKEGQYARRAVIRLRQLVEESTKQSSLSQRSSSAAHDRTAQNKSRGKMTNALARVAAVFTVSFLP